MRQVCINIETHFVYLFFEGISTIPYAQKHIDLCLWPATTGVSNNYFPR